jgi:hypothetical protein
VVGGNSRNIGKTSVVAGWITRLPEMHWTAFKLTQHGHQVCDGTRRSCDCIAPDHSVSLHEETNPTSGKDSARFLYAGAVRSVLVRARQGSLAQAMSRLRSEFAAAENVVVESNSVMEYLYPNLYLIVLDPRTADFKDSAALFLERADAVLWSNKPLARRQAVWPEAMHKQIEGKPQFVIGPPDFVTDELIAFVVGRLG